MMAISLALNLGPNNLLLALGIPAKGIYNLSDGLVELIGAYFIGALIFSLFGIYVTCFHFESNKEKALHEARLRTLQAHAEEKLDKAYKMHRDSQRAEEKLDKACKMHRRSRENLAEALTYLQQARKEALASHQRNTEAYKRLQQCRLKLSEAEDFNNATIQQLSGTQTLDAYGVDVHGVSRNAIRLASAAKALAESALTREFREAQATRIVQEQTHNIVNSDPSSSSSFNPDPYPDPSSAVSVYTSGLTAAARSSANTNVGESSPSAHTYVQESTA